jgi:hypothetical protein
VRTGVAILFLVWSAAVAAAEDNLALVQDGPQVTERYAEQILASDVAAIGLAVAGDQADQRVMRDVGFGVGLAGAPFIHITNGNYRGAAGSLALRITLPFAAAYLGEKLAPSEDPTQIKSSHVIGLAVGLMAVSLIDSTTLAKKKVRRPPERHWRPDLSFKNGGVRVLVATKF